MNFAAPEGVVAEILGVHTNHHQGEIMGISWEHNNGISWYCIFGCFWSCRFNGEKWWSTVGFCSNKPWFTIFDLFRIEHNSWFAYPPVPIKHGKPLTKKRILGYAECRNDNRHLMVDATISIYHWYPELCSHPISVGFEFRAIAISSTCAVFWQLFPLPSPGTKRWSELDLSNREPLLVHWLIIIFPTKQLCGLNTC